MRLSSSTRKRPRNQRVSNPRQRKQQHLLDVKVRARKATQQRNRRVLVVLSKFVLTVAISAEIDAGADRDRQHKLRKDNKHSPIALLRGFARASGNAPVL